MRQNLKQRSQDGNMAICLLDSAELQVSLQSIYPAKNNIFITLMNLKAAQIFGLKSKELQELSEVMHVFPKNSEGFVIRRGWKGFYTESSIMIEQAKGNFGAFKTGNGELAINFGGSDELRDYFCKLAGITIDLLTSSAGGFLSFKKELLPAKVDRNSFVPSKLQIANPITADAAKFILEKYADKLHEIKIEMITHKGDAIFPSNLSYIIERFLGDLKLVNEGKNGEMPELVSFQPPCINLIALERPLIEGIFEASYNDKPLLMIINKLLTQKGCKPGEFYEDVITGEAGKTKILENPKPQISGPETKQEVKQERIGME